MTDRQPPDIPPACEVRPWLAGWTWLRVGCLFLALSSEAVAYEGSVDTIETIVVEGELCTVLETHDKGKTTKPGLYPLNTEVEVLLLNCGIPSPVKRSLIRYFLPGVGGPPFKEFVAASALGAVIALNFAEDPFVVGTFQSAGSSFKPYHAFRFDLDTKAFQDLGAFGGPAGTSAAIGVNIDGTVVVGASNLTTAGASVHQAFRWTPALGMKNLGAIAPESFSEARGTSDDGTVVVGMTYAPGTATGPAIEPHAFRWVLSNPATGAGTMTDLRPATSSALAVSSDGSVIVGLGTGMRAFRWTQAGGVVDLGVLPGHSRAMATAVSADGQVVVGISSSKFILAPYPDARPSYDIEASRAFRWTQATGIQDLNTLLTAAGVDLKGVTLLSALGLSSDGQTIVGSGIRAGAEDTLGFTVRYANATTFAAPVSVVEFYNAALDHYFITYVVDEIAKLDNGTFKGWARTGLSFKAYATAQSGTSAVCRIYIPPGKGDGHFFGRDTNECDGTMAKNPTFILESSTFLYLYPPTLGTCATGQLPVYRVFSNRADANHRYSTSRAVRDQMVSKGWLAEGDGADIVVMCAPS